MNRQLDSCTNRKIANSMLINLKWISGEKFFFLFPLCAHTVRFGHVQGVSTRHQVMSQY
uniref:Uncharacterized protein n=1 Tax=Arundo donax TaxID=35708 RepID=A0A0A9DFH7_ARUDO